MSHHAATLQSAFDKTATVLDFAYTVADRLYWLDDNYVQPFYAWAAPRLRDVAISGLYWALITFIDVSLWLINTTRQFMARDAHAIALHSFSFTHPHEPLPEFPALCPATVPLALTSMLLPMAPAPEALYDAAPVLALCPTVVPMVFSQFLNPDHSIRGWLTSALPLVLASWVTEALAIPVSPAVAPVVKKSRKSKATDTKTDKTPRKRSPKKPTAATAQ